MGGGSAAAAAAAERAPLPCHVSTFLSDLSRISSIHSRSPLRFASFLIKDISDWNNGVHQRRRFRRRQPIAVAQSVQIANRSVLRVDQWHTALLPNHQHPARAITGGEFCRVRVRVGVVCVGLICM